MTGGIGYVCSGSDSHLATFEDFAGYLDQMIYLREIASYDLNLFGAVVIPDFSDQSLLHRHSRQLNAYLADGGFLIVFEPVRMDTWIDVVDIPWFERPTADWKWWMKPGGRLEVYQPEPKHPLAEAIPVEDMSWHFFGAFQFFDGARPILNLDGDEGCLMFDYRTQGGGRLIGATIDPHSHNGHRFMPATTRFLQRFYPWLKAEIAA